MRKSIKRTVATGVVAAGLVLGGTGVVAATTGASLPGAASSPNGSENGNDSQDQGTPIAGTITAPPETTDGADGTEASGDETAQDAAETTALEGLATVTRDEAKAAALAAVSGTAGQVQLEEEDGFVVYHVEVAAADGTVTEVIIDAGNGSVLAQEAGDAKEANDTADANGTNDTPDANEGTGTPAP